MTKSSIIKVFRATRCLPLLILQLCLMVWTYDLIGSAESTQITQGICRNAVNSSVESICCHPTLEQDEHLEACSHYLNTSESENEMSNTIQLSKFAECVYKKRNYMKSGTQLNMGRVRADANRLYQNDTLMKDYRISTYRYCARYAIKQVELLKQNEKGRDLLTQMNNPFFLFHFNCVVKKFYSKTKCPYFIWKGETESDGKICDEFSAQCI